jgi:hypothetical protein
MKGNWAGWVVFLAVVWGLGCGSAHDDDTGIDATDDGTTLEDGADGDADGSPDDAMPCEAGLEPCGTGCVDTDTDPANCGSCGNACPDGLHSIGACAAGACGLECLDGWYDVDAAAGCEYECVAATPPTESCNARDDDCNGERDDGFACVRDSTDTCTTSCGTEGTNLCDSTCTWVCTPPTEVCDGIDQDCDGVADEGPYGVVWDVVGVEPLAPSRVLSFSIAVAADEIGLGYVLALAEGAETGAPRMLRFRAGDGTSPGAATNLAAAATARSIRASGSSSSVASFVWDVTDGAVARGESLLIRSALLGAGYSMGAAGAVDGSDETVSIFPSVARHSTDDVAAVAWVELIAPAPAIQIAVSQYRLAPGNIATASITGLASPSTPDLAIHADSTILVIWSEGSPGEIKGQRFNMSLEPQGERLALSATAAASTIPRVAASDSRFMLVWQEEGAGVFLSVVLPDGTIGTPATLLAGSGSRPVIAPDLIGGFAVAYETASGVEVLRLSPAGIPAGDPILFAAGRRPEITSIPAGGLVLAYDAEGTIRLARLGCAP